MTEPSDAAVEAAWRSYENYARLVKHADDETVRNMRELWDVWKEVNEISAILHETLRTAKETDDTASTAYATRTLFEAIGPWELISTFIQMRVTDHKEEGALYMAGLMTGWYAAHRRMARAAT